METCPICGATEETGVNAFAVTDEQGRVWSFCMAGNDHGITEVDGRDVVIPTLLGFTYDVNNYLDRNGRAFSHSYNPNEFLFQVDINGRCRTLSTIPWSQVTTGSPVGGYPELKS